MIRSVAPLRSLTKSLKEGTNYRGGLDVYYFLPDTLSKKDTLTITVFNSKGDSIIDYSSAHKEKNYVLKPKKGMNRFNWNLYSEPAKRFDGMVIWGGSGAGPKSIPGDYRVEMRLNNEVYKHPFTITKDPRSTATMEDYAEYEVFVTALRDKISAAHEAIIEIRDIRTQLNNYKARVEDEGLKKEISRIDSTMTSIEEALYQTKNQSNQDPLNFPIRLTDKLSYVGSIVGNGEFPPTEQAYGVRNELMAQIDKELARLAMVKNEMIPAFNKLVREKSIDAIILKKS